MLLYYITDRRQFGGNHCVQRERLLAKITEAAGAGVDYIQLRERDLRTRDLEALAQDAAQAVREATSTARIHESEDPGSQQNRPRTRLLINSRTDVALATGAGGVHLRSDDIPASEARVIWSKAAREATNRTNGDFVIAVSCHISAEVRYAEAHGADFAVFAPVFEKTTAPPRAGSGLAALREACAGPGAPPNVEGVGAVRMPVLALGGITLENARACIDAGAAGIAAIRLFQENDVSEVVFQLREMNARSR